MLKAKGFRFERKEDTPISTMGPRGILAGMSVNHRFILKDKNPTLKFIPTVKGEKKEKKEKLMVNK